MSMEKMAEGNPNELAKDEECLHTDTISPIENAETCSLTGSLHSAADFEEAIKKTGYGKFNYLLILLALPAACSSNFDTTALAYALPTATCDLKLDAYDRGYLNGTIYAGMILSAFFWGYVSDKFGRQKMLVIGYFGDVVFGVAASFSQGFWTLLIFKILSGAMICGPFSIFMSYLAELFGSKRRDSVVMMVGLFQAIGGIIQPLIAWAIIPRRIHWILLDGLVVINSWRLFLLVCMVPAFIAGVGSLFCHESPRFLLAKGRKDEALRVFRSIYSVNTGKPANMYTVKKLKSELNIADEAHKKSFWQEITAIFHPPYLQKALLIFAIQFGGLITLNTIRLWLPQLFFYIKEVEDPEAFSTCEILSRNQTVPKTQDCDNFKVDTSVYMNMLYVSILTTTSFAVCTATVGYFGKKNLLVTLFLMQSAVICALGWVHPPFTMAMAAVFVTFSNTSAIMLLGFVVQIFPTKLRTMAVSLTMMFGRIGVCIGSAVLPFFLALTCEGTFVGISLITLFCGLVLYILAVAASRSETEEKSHTKA